MLRVLRLTLLLFAVAGGVVQSGEFPIVFWNDPYTMDTAIVPIDSAYSHLSDIGATYILGWAMPASVTAAASHGLKIVAHNDAVTGQIQGPAYQNKLIVTDSTTPDFLEDLAGNGIYMAWEAESDVMANGYWFDYDSDVGDIQVDESGTYYRSLVADHSEGTLLSGPVNVISLDSSSIMAYMPKKPIAGDTGTAAFVLSRGSVDDTLKIVCELKVIKLVTQETVGIDTVFAYEVDISKTWDTVEVRFPICNDNCEEGYYLTLSVYWFDQVDMKLDKVIIYNRDGLVIKNDTTVSNKIGAYLDSLQDYEDGMYGYHLADEPYPSAIPTLQITDIKFAQHSNNIIRVESNMSGGWQTSNLTEVYINYMNPRSYLMNYYWYNCSMPLATDTVISYDWPDCSDPAWNIQHTLDKFAAFIDTQSQVCSEKSTPFWPILQSSAFVEYDSNTGLFTQLLNDPNKQVLSANVYLAMMHGAEGLAFWQYSTYGGTGQPASEPETDRPLSWENPRGDCSPPDTCTCDENIFGYRARGLEDIVNGQYQPNEKWYALKSVLDKAIPMGQILVDLDLQDIGLTNNETAVGFVDSVVGEFRDPVTGTEDWIEAAVFEDNQTGDDYFMLVNRRLLSSEDNEVTVYLDTSQLAGDWYYFVIDQSSFDTILVNEDSSFAFHAHLEPGEGYLYKVTRAELCGDMSGYVNGSFYVVGDITVEEDDTLSIGWATLAFKEIDNLASGVDTTKPEIIVKGTLILGHEMEAAPGFGIGSWYGIRVVDNGRLENLCGMVGDSYYIRDAYIGLSFEDNTTSAYLEGGCEVPDAGGDLIIEDCQAGGMYLCTEEIEFADAIWVPTERDSTHTPVIIRNIPEGYGIKFTGDNCPDFNWLMSIENCKYGFYVGGSDDMIHDVWINNDSVDNAYGIYHYSNSASPTLDLRHIIVTGVFNTMDYLYAKSKQNIYECLFHSSSDSTLTGIYASGLGKATMRRSAVGFAKTCIYAANGVSDFGLTTDSGWNSIVINRDDTSTRSVNFDGLGTLKAYGNYWGEPNGNGYRFEGSVGFEPFLEDGIEHSWVCDSIPAYFDACNMAQNYMPGDPQEKVATHAEEQQIPFEFSLSNSYPNPFNPSCRIDYSLARSCGVEIVVYNILGQRVRTLVNDERPAGPNTVIWDGKNEQGGDVASGLYFYKMRAADFTKIQKMMLLK